MKQLRRTLRFILLATALVVVLAVFHATSLWGVKQQVHDYLDQLKAELRARNYSASTFVISGRRFRWLNPWGVRDSRHLYGEAIDIIVLDVNDDGTYDEKDVEIVYRILDEEIVKDAGGVGTYTGEPWLINRQQVHFDCRGWRARWRH